MTIGPSDYLEELEVREMELLKNTSLPGVDKYAFQACFISEFRSKFYNVQEQCHKGLELSKAEMEFAIYAAPGSGKTKMGAECMITSNTGLWLAHTDELMDHAYKQLRATCKEHGIPESAVKKLTFKEPKALEDWIEKQQNLPEADREKYVVVSTGKDSRWPPTPRNCRMARWPCRGTFLEIFGEMGRS